MPDLNGLRIALTGATGFLGGHLLPLLLRAGAEVTCIVRPSSDTGALPERARTATADLSSGCGLADALRGHDVLIHMAALLFGLSWQDYLRANTQAAQNICRALDGMDMPRKTILISSLSATGPCAMSPGATDDATPAPVSAYGWSKLLVERTFAAAYGGELVTLRPPIIYGSGDRGLLPVFRGAARGIAVSPGLGRDFPVSCIHGHDMARAILACLTNAVSGVYHVSDGSIYTMEQFCRTMASALGRSHLRVVHVPLPVMALTAAASTLWGTVWAAARTCLAGRGPKRAPNWNIDKYREARQIGWVGDGSRLSQKTGFTPELSLAEGMEEAVRGYRQRGWL